MLDLFIDIDNCPVYRQVLLVAQRHALALYAVTRDYVELEGDVHLILAQAGDAGGQEWIVGNIRRSDICVTDDATLAADCLRRGAFALTATGWAWTAELAAAEESRAGAVDAAIPRHRLRQSAIDVRQFVHRIEQTIAEARSAKPQQPLRPSLYDKMTAMSP